MTDETPDVTARARAALDGITPGPWVRDNPDDRFSEHDDVFSGDVWSRRVAGLISRRADSTFIAAAPDLVRDLLAENERLRTGKAIEDAFSQVIAAEAEADATQRDLDQARAAVDRVRKLHQSGLCGCGCGDTVCSVCVGDTWPCATLRALDGEASS